MPPSLKVVGLARPSAFMLAWPQEAPQVREAVKVFENQTPRTGDCPFCSMSQVLRYRVVWYRHWSSDCCTLCGRCITRLLRWSGEARKRWLGHRLRRPGAAEDEPTNMETRETTWDEPVATTG